LKCSTHDVCPAYCLKQANRLVRMSLLLYISSVTAIIAEVLALSEMDMCVTSTIASPSGVGVCGLAPDPASPISKRWVFIGMMVTKGSIFAIRRVCIIPLSRDMPHNLEEVRTPLQLSLTSQRSSCETSFG